MWIAQYPAQPWHKRFNTCVYQRHNASAAAYVRNVAFEAGVYLRYIVDHYHALSAVTAFVQEDAGADVGARIGCLRTDAPFGWAPLGGIFVAGRDLSIWRARGEATAVHACWSQLAADFGIYLPPGIEPAVSFYCCAYFAMTRAQIQRYSHATYRRAYERLVLQPHCHDGEAFAGVSVTRANDKDTSAGAFEHLQHALLGGQQLNMREFEAGDWCARFAPRNATGCAADSPCA